MPTFISHSSRDLNAAIEVLRTLHFSGYPEIYLDADPSDGLKAGSSFTDQLAKGHRKADSVIVLVSKNWLTSFWCQAELRAALLAQKKVIPVLIEPIDQQKMPDEISSVQYINWKNERAGNELIKAIPADRRGRTSKRSNRGGSAIITEFKERTALAFRQSRHYVAEFHLKSRGLITFVASNEVLGLIPTKMGVSCWPRDYQHILREHLRDIAESLSSIRDQYALDRVIIVEESADYKPPELEILKKHNIDSITIQALENKSLGATSYLENADQIYKSHAGGNFVDLNVRENNPETEITTEVHDVAKYLADSYQSDDFDFYFLTGDFGSGKTTIAEHVHRMLSDQFIAGHSNLFPMIFYLKTLAQFDNETKFIESQIANVSPDASKELFDRMCEQGRVLAILDGFDEIATNSTLRERSVYFSRLFNITQRCDKVLLTSRPAIFTNFSELNDIVGNIIDAAKTPAHKLEHGSRSKDMQRNRAIEKNASIMRSRIMGPEQKRFPAASSRIATVLPLDENKMLKFFERHSGPLRTKHNKTPKEIYDSLLEVYDLSEIITRPLLIEMFVYVLLEGTIDLDDPDLFVGPIALYQQYVNLHLDREENRSRFLSKDARLGFARAAAKAMLLKGGSLEATLDQLAAVVRETDEIQAHLGSEVLERDIEKVTTDVRTCGFVNITEDDRIVFSHKSFMEFFVADIIYRSITSGNYSEELELPLNYEILQFVGGFGMLRMDFRFDLTQHMSKIGRSVSDRYRTNVLVALLFSDRDQENKRFGEFRFDGIKITKKDFKECEFNNTTFTSAEVGNVAFEYCKFNDLSILGDFYSNSFDRCSGNIVLPHKAIDIRLDNSDLSVGGVKELHDTSVTSSKITFDEDVVDLRRSVLTQSLMMHPNSNNICLSDCEISNCLFTPNEDFELINVKKYLEQNSYYKLDCRSIDNVGVFGWVIKDMEFAMQFRAYHEFTGVVFVRDDSKEIPSFHKDIGKGKKKVPKYIGWLRSKDLIFLGSTMVREFQAELHECSEALENALAQSENFVSVVDNFEKKLRHLV